MAACPAGPGPTTLALGTFPGPVGGFLGLVLLTVVASMQSVRPGRPGLNRGSPTGARFARHGCAGFCLSFRLADLGALRPGIHRG